MRIEPTSRFVLSIAAAAGALLTGCGEPLAPQFLAASHAVSGATQDTKNVGWMYVSDDAFSIGIVYIFPYPDTNYGRTKAITGIGNVYGACGDSSGHAWVPVQEHGRQSILEFVAGRTKRIGRLDLPKYAGIGQCAVDPVTGNLAVVGTNAVNVFAQAKGKPTNYSLGNTNVRACTYDGSGDLFVDGMKPISTSQEVFALYELRKGSAAFSRVTLDKRAGVSGGLEWDGTYVAVATGGNGIKPVIYRFSVTGSKGTVAQVVRPKGLNFQAWFAAADGKMVGTSGLYGPRIRLWPYPGGGQWQWEMKNLQTDGIAIVTYPPG